MPLIVVIDPVDNATLDGVGVGRTDENGVYDRVRVSAGSRDARVAVDATVIFSTQQDDDPSRSNLPRVRNFATKRLVLDDTVQAELSWSTPGRSSTRLAEPVNQSADSNVVFERSLRAGETAELDFQLRRGRAPLIGQFVEITLLGEGQLDAPNRITNTAGEVRFQYTAPEEQVGRARIAVSYSIDGQTFTETATIDYSDADVEELDPVYSRAQLTAESAAGLLISQAAQQAILGNEGTLDRPQLADIARSWRDSGLHDDGSINEAEDCGVRCKIAESTSSSIDSRSRFLELAAVEFFRWTQMIDQLGLADELTEPSDPDVLDLLSNETKAAIDALVQTALTSSDAPYARSAMKAATLAQSAGLLSSGDEAIYGVDAVRDRLGYEIRIDEAELHGEADSGWLQVTTRLYLRDPNNTQQSVPAGGNSPIDVEVFALGFSLVNTGEIITDGIFGSEVSIARGDTELRLLIHARDEFATGDTFEIRRSGKTSLVSAARLASNELAPLQDSLTLYASQQAHIEGVVTRGLGRDRTRDVLFTVAGAPQDSVQRLEGQGDAFVFTPPEGQSGTATITLSLHADGAIRQSEIEIVYSDGTGPEGEVVVEAANRVGGSGLLNNSHVIGAFNQVAVPLAASGEDAMAGNAFGLGGFQFPFDGGLPSVGGDLGNWFNEIFDLLHLADLETLLGLLNGLPGDPEDIVRFKFDASAALGDPGTLLAADISGLLPEGFEGSVSLDKPELSGQIVFGIDTSSSPLYVLTQPDRLLTENPTFEDFLGGGAEEARFAGLETTELGAAFGVSASFRSSEPLIDGILEVPFAEGYLSSKLKVDFSEVAKSTGKLRLNNLAELANLQIGFDGSAIDTFQAIASARVTLPNLAGVNDNDHPLANVNVVGAIHKPSPSTTGTAEEDAPWEFQLRTADLFQLDAELRSRLSTDVVSSSSDALEPNDDWQKIDRTDAANFGLLNERLQHDQLELADSADWYRFETGETGDASNFARVDFDSMRGDLDLSLYRLVDSELVHVRTDDLAFGDTASITLLGQPQGTYFLRVFDDDGALQPYYALTIEPPGKLQPGIQAQIGDFQVLDTSLAITVDTNLEFSGSLDGRIVMNFAEQDDAADEQVAVEVGFRASIDTVADDPNENGGIYAELTTGLGNEAIQTLALQDANGSLIPPPSRSRFESRIDPDIGGYLIFDYESSTDFKFAGLDAANDRFVMGAYDGDDGWVVPADADHRAVANLDADPLGLVLLFDGNDVTLAVSDGSGDPKTVLTKTYASIPNGDLGLGTPDGSARFYDAYLYAGSEEELLFADFFNQSAKPEWKPSKGVWSIDDSGRWMARGSSLTFGDALHIDSATLRGFLDIQFNDNDILAVPAINPQTEDEGKIEVGFELSDVNALLFRTEDGGTPLYDDQDDSPRGSLAINDGFLTLGPTGLSLGAGEVRAVIADVLHVDIVGAEFNLTNDPGDPLFATSDIGIRIPSLSDDANFVTISGANPGERLFGISQPSTSDLIPEFLLFQDTIEINFDTGLLQEEFIDVGGVFPFTPEKVAIRFNDAGDENGTIGNLSDFDLLVAGQIDFSNSIFDGLPFDPVFAIGQPQLRDPVNGERQVRLSGSDAYVDSCDTTMIEAAFGQSELCQNGFVSAELGLGSLLGNQTPLIKNLGPIYLGFQDLNLFRDGDAVEDPDDVVNAGINLHGLLQIAGFQDGEFIPEISGELVAQSVDDEGNREDLGTLAVAGQFTGPTRVNEDGTPDPLGDRFQRSLELDWFGQASGEIGSQFNVSVEDAAVRIKTIFTNTYTDTEPFNVSVEILPQTIDSGNLCIELGNIAQLCGSGFVNVAAGDNEPFMIVRSGQLLLGDSLGPLSNVKDTDSSDDNQEGGKTGITAGGFGVGRDGTLYVIPAGYSIPDPDDPGQTFAEFEDGAFVTLDSSQLGGIFGFPEWVPVEVRKLGLQFLGVADGDNDGVNDPLTIAPPTKGEISQIVDDDELSEVLGVDSIGVQSLANRVINEVIPITDPDNLRLTLSGGFTGNGMFPVIGEFERLQLHLGKLAGCVAVAAAQHGIDVVNSQVGYLFDSACEFPIEGLDGATVGIEPIDLGPLTVGGNVGLGVFRFDRPNDPDDPSAGTTQQNVFYGRLEGTAAIADFGFGVSGIITQYGPVLMRGFSPIPVPISAIVGLLGGPVGTALGAGAGFWLTGMEAGLIFDADPLPTINEPTDIFAKPKLRTPLKVTGADIENTVRELAFENPTFTELVGALSEFDKGVDLGFAFTELLSGRVPLPGGQSVKFTWDSGFRFVASGTLTNQYVAGQLGLDVTLGLNVGYDFDALRIDGEGNPITELPDPLPANWPRHPNGEPAMDFDGVALDADGNRLDENGDPIGQGISETIATFDDLFGFQLFGFADLEVFGFPLVGAGVLFDFDDPINPVINVAASLPARDGLLSLLLPAQGVIGASLDFDGLVEGNILSALVLLQEFKGQTTSFVGELLDVVGNNPDTGQLSPMGILANRLETDRRASLGILRPTLSDNEPNPDYDPTFDPRFTGYDPSDSSTNPTLNLWMSVLDLDGNGFNAETEHQPITREFLIDRVLDLNPVDLVNQLGQLVINGWLRVTSAFMQEMVLIGPTLVTSPEDAATLTDGIPFWAAIEAQMRASHAGVRLFAETDAQRELLDDAFEANLLAARVSTAINYAVAEASLNSIGAAAQRYAEVIDPKLRITGQLSPMLLGIPMGPPSQEVDITVSKHELTVRGNFSVMKQMLNMSAIPAIVADQTRIDAHFPFENLLSDVYAAELPKIDPLADDWRIAIDASASVAGFEIQNQSGLIFPAGATQYLGERIQRYDADSAEGSVTIEENKILVREQDYQFLLAEGGLLYDGRLTLPRFLTDPVGLWDDLHADPDFADQIAAISGSDCEDIWSCITAHPVEVFGLLSRLPDLIGDATSIEEVSQVQLFIPNFIDDIIDSFDPQTRAELDALTAQGSDATADDVIAFIRREVSDAIGDGYAQLQNAYLIGSYGQYPSAIADAEQLFDESAFAFPTTSKILGVELGSGQLSGKLTESGFDTDLAGTFLGLADVQFEANLNTFTDPALMRVGGEVVVGYASEACGSLPSPLPGEQSAQQISDQVAAFLAHVGFYESLDAGARVVGSAFDWFVNNNDAGLCVRAFSPGFDPLAVTDDGEPDELKRRGGIAAHAQLEIADFLKGDFDFEVTPSATFDLVPNVVVSGTASQVLLPGLEGLSPSGQEDVLFGSELAIRFQHIDGSLSSSLGGSITLFGQSLSLSADQSLAVTEDGLVGSLSFDQSLSLGGTLMPFELGGELSLEFDTSLSNPSASIAVRDGHLRLFNAFELSGASFRLTVDSAGIHVTNVSGDMELFGNRLSFGGSFSITPNGLPTGFTSFSETLSINIDPEIPGLGFGPGNVQGELTLELDENGFGGAFSGTGTIFGITQPTIAGQFHWDGCLAITSPVVAEFELPGLADNPNYGCDAAHEVAVALTLMDVDTIVEGDSGTQLVQIEVEIATFGAVEPFELEVPWEVTPAGGLSFPGEQKFFVTESTSSINIEFVVVGNTEYQDAIDYIVTIDGSQINLKGGNATWYVADEMTVLTVLNDDEQD
ncbi:MAG: hypothetical protein AAF802_15815, partial [Planctomycetota bacterium]